MLVCGKGNDLVIPASCSFMDGSVHHHSKRRGFLLEVTEFGNFSRRHLFLSGMLLSLFIILFRAGAWQMVPCVEGLPRVGQSWFHQLQPIHHRAKLSPTAHGSALGTAGIREGRMLRGTVRQP